jgi:hypothetical protein
VLSYQPRPANGLFISPSTKRVVVPLHWAQHATTGRADRTDRTRCTASGHHAPSTCPSAFNTERLISTVTACQWSSAMIGRAAQPTGRAGAHSTRARDNMTGRAPRNDRMRQCQRPVVVQRAPIVTGRVRSCVTGCATRSISSSPRSTPLGARSDAPVP